MNFHQSLKSIENIVDKSLPEKIRMITALYFTQGPGALGQKETASFMLAIEGLATQELIDQRSKSSPRA